MGETMNPITFTTAAMVRRLEEVIQWNKKVPDATISEMVRAINGGKSVLMLAGQDHAIHGAPIAMVMPGHDDGWLAMELCLRHPYREATSAILILDPTNRVHALTGEPVKRDQLAFSPEVDKALNSWRAKS